VIHHSSVKVGKSQESFKLRLALSRCASGVWPLQNGFCFGGVHGDPLVTNDMTWKVDGGHSKSTFGAFNKQLVLPEKREHGTQVRVRGAPQDSWSTPVRHPSIQVQNG